jgi:membrane-bound serine protease (ClpP class)
MRSAALAFFLTHLFGAPGTRAEPTVLVASWDDAITPVTGDYLNDAMTRALEDSAAAFVIVLDTPGGLLDSTRDIVSRFLESEIPVIVWVGPAGARAASAGTFLTLAAHVAAMAPGTNIGAASPITMGGGGADSTMGHKMQNDAAAFIRTIAERRGRNVAWAERTVRDASASTEKEALDAGAIDLIAASVEEVLEKASGRTVQTKNGATTLELRGARIEHYELDLRTKILSLLANPNVAYLLLMLGFYGIFFELSNPGSVLPGVVGAIFLILAFYSMQQLPLNAAGLLMVAVGLILFILEIKVTSYGLLTIGGIAATVLGAVMLFDSPEPALRVSLRFVIPFTIATALLFATGIGLAVRTMRKPPTTGREGMVGWRGRARTLIDPEGTVEVRGELWRARANESIEEGAPVEVTGAEGLVLRVRKPAAERGA